MSNITELTFPYEYKELEPKEKVALGKSYLALRDFVRLGPKGYAVFRRYQTDAANIYNMPLRTSDIFVASILRSGPDVDFVRLEPDGFLLLRRFLLDAANIYNLEVRPDDVFVVTYQRSGTTLTQELVWLVAHDLDYETAKKVPIPDRYPFLDKFMFFDDKWKMNIVQGAGDKQKALEVTSAMSHPQSSKIAAMPSPRFIKTHLPLTLLPPKLLDTAKVVYVARDPRDVAVSSYHHSKLFKVLDFPSSFKDFWSLFVKNLFTLTPYFAHVKQAWAQRNHPNMLFLFYEDLTERAPETILRVAEFFGKHINDAEVVRLCDHLKVDNFKKNKAVNFEQCKEFGVMADEETFIRKGKAGGWREYFDAEMCAQAQRWIDDNLRGTDLRFPTVE